MCLWFAFSIVSSPKMLSLWKHLIPSLSSQPRYYFFLVPSTYSSSTTLVDVVMINLRTYFVWLACDKEYNATIEFYWAPFLLESNSDNAVVHRISDRIVRKGSINKHGRNWKGVDILVFNTYLWWMTGLKMKIL